MSGSGGNQTAGIPPITDNPEGLPVEVPAMTEENEPASTAVSMIGNGTGTGVPCVPASSTPVTFHNAANTCPAITMQSGISQNDLLKRFAQIPQEQMTRAGLARRTRGSTSSHVGQSVKELSHCCVAVVISGYNFA